MSTKVKKHPYLFPLRDAADNDKVTLIPVPKMSARNVTTIPATITRFTHAPLAARKKRRTAGYARVSTDSDEQFTSYAAQVDYYEKYIKSREDWEFVSVYTDEGISGTSTAHREGFKAMIANALAGKSI